MKKRHKIRDYRDICQDGVLVCDLEFGGLKTGVQIYSTGNPGIKLAQSNKRFGQRAVKKYIKTGNPIGRAPRVKRKDLAVFFKKNPYAEPCEVKHYFQIPTTTAHTYVSRYRSRKYDIDIMSIEAVKGK